MSYYRYITGIYKSYKPELNRTLRSSSVPRHVPAYEPERYARSSSVPPSAYYSRPTFSHAATPFRDRAMSVPRQVSYSHHSVTRHDCAVTDYQARLEREDAAKTYVSTNRSSTLRHYPADSFSSHYNYYDANKHGTDYLYPITNDVLGSWKHYNLSADTLNFRNMRARSPIMSRELDRYQGSNQISEFRHYNYRPVPYFGGSDDYHHLRRCPISGRRIW